MGTTGTTASARAAKAAATKGKAQPKPKEKSPAMPKAKPKAKTKAKTKAKLKTTATAADVGAFIAGVDNATRRQDAQALVALLRKITGWQPKMWGPSIIGFGAYHYTYASGHSGTMCAIGFSPRKANLVVYVADFPGKDLLLAKLGKHKGGDEQCLYINRLADVDLAVLGQILEGGLAQMKKTWPVTAA